MKVSGVGGQGRGHAEEIDLARDSRVVALTEVHAVVGRVGRAALLRHVHVADELVGCCSHTRARGGQSLRAAQLLHE